MSGAAAGGFPQAMEACATLSVISIGILVVYLLLSATYNLLLHPLHDIPGPRLCAISRMPWWIANYHGDQVSYLCALHDQYGPVVRYGPNDLSYSNGDAWKDIYGYERGRKENPKQEKTYLPPFNGVKNMVTANEQDHARVRRIFSPAFSDRALKKQEPLFQKYMHLLVGNLKKSSGEQVDLVDLFNFTIFDIMGDLTLGQPLGLLENNKYTPWVTAIFSSIKVLGIIQFIEYYPALSALWKLLEPRSIYDMKMNHWNHTKDRVDARLARGSTQPDVWNLCVPDDEKGQAGLSLKEMHSNAEIMMLAGTETTASALSGLFYTLLTHPAEMERAKAEVRAAFASGRDMTLESMGGLKYLHACISEAMRVYPRCRPDSPVLSPKAATWFWGDGFPKVSTNVVVMQAAAYRSPEGWKDPGRYVPERWLGGGSAGEYRDDRRDWHQPFSFGPRNCLGQNLAWHEMRLVAASILFHFDVELCEHETGDWFDQKSYMAWERRPLICRVKYVGQ
ncbi:Cytochrome P450 monooxygenase [Apiospora kogelbergensis]|uniref:Cytochrome P450 monooxygenase n=1 Tax=Apiospora kogelbergensis TaxID=1337665 RepID=A0AAW0QDQ8_9PEZI